MQPGRLAKCLKLTAKFNQLDSWEQGLTLRFQARGLKRSFDKNKWSKTGFLVIIHTILGPWSEKSRGPQQNLGAYGPGPLWMSNPGEAGSIIKDIVKVSYH